VNEFNVVYQQFIAMYDSVCQTCSNRSRLTPGLGTSTPKYHAATDKHRLVFDVFFKKNLSTGIIFFFLKSLIFKKLYAKF